MKNFKLSVSSDLSKVTDRNLLQMFIIACDMDAKLDKTSEGLIVLGDELVRRGYTPNYHAVKVLL